MEMEIGELERNLKDSNMNEEINNDDLSLVEAIGTMPLLMFMDIYDKAYSVIKRIGNVVKGKIDSISSFVFYGIRLDDRLSDKDDEKRYSGKMRFKF
jgi:hypothetical protein